MRKFVFAVNLGLDAQEVCTRSSFEEEGEEERERRKEREREGRRDQKRKNLHACKDLVLVHAHGLGQGRSGMTQGLSID